MRCLSVALVAAITLAGVLPARAMELNGSGSTFAFPIMTQWLKAYDGAGGTTIQYQPIGSTGGITELAQNIVDFAITDAPLGQAELQREGLAQFPLVIGGIAIAVHLDGIGPGQLHLTGDVLAAIYQGSITRWNDPAIAALNPGLRLPNLAILPVYRSDGSGTTYNFTEFLGKASVSFHTGIGSGTIVRWPLGVGARGTGGVGIVVRQIKGAIGYVEYSYAARSGMTTALVRNKAGHDVAPSVEGFRIAAAAMDWASEQDFHMSVTDAAGPEAYPIVATSYVLMRSHPADPLAAQQLLRFFNWALEHGSQMAISIGYLPLPQTLVQQIQAQTSRLFDGAMSSTRAAGRPG